MQGQSSYTVSIPVGTSIKLRVPTDLKTGLGFFPSSETTMYIEGKELDLLQGFAVKNTTVGNLTKVPSGLHTGDPEVIYTHLKQQENKIYFFSDNKLFQTVDILNIPIHDHSSIIQGGPAFGTYYTDYQENKNEGK